MQGNTSFAKRVLGTPPESQIPVTDASEGPDQTALATRSMGHVPMLEFRFKNGARESLAYSYLWRAKYHPDKGITLIYPSFGEVIIKGHGLTQLYAEISAHKRSIVEELSSPAAALSGRDRGHVSEIRFEEEHP